MRSSQGQTVDYAGVVKRVLVVLALGLGLAVLAFVAMREGLVPTPEFLSDTVGRRGGEPPAPLEAAADDDADAEEPGDVLRAAPRAVPRPASPERGPATAAVGDGTTIVSAALSAVVVGEGGRPIPGAHVTVSRFGVVFADGTTDAEGRVRLEVAIGIYDVRVSAGRDGVFDAQGVVIDGRGFDGKFQLTPAASLEVAVTREGRGLGGVPVTVRANEDGSTRVLVSGSTDGSGTVRFPELVAGNVLVETVDAQGLAVRTKAALTGGARTTLELAYPAMVVWSGVVRDAETLAGLAARIELDVDGAGGLRYSVAGASDASGVFVVSVPQGKPSGLRVTSADHAAFPAPKELGAVLGAIAGLKAASIQHDLLLRRGAAASGLAKGPDGHGVADLELVFRGDRGAQTTVTTDATGRYAIATLSPGAYGVFVSSPGWYLKAGSVRLAVPAPTEAGPASLTLDLDVLSARTVSGSVGLADGSPAIGAHVWLVGGRGVVRGARNAGRALETFTGADGTFALDDVPPVAGVRVRASLGDVEAIPSEPMDLQTLVPPPVRLVLTPTVTVVGRVTDLRTGEPVTGARVDARPIGDPASRGGGNVTTGPDGRYELVRRIPGRWALTANRRRDHLPGEPKEIVLVGTASPVTLDLVLDPGLAIAGTVLDADRRPIAGAKLALSGTEDGAPVDATVTRGGGSDANGAFRWTALRSGRYTLRVSRKGFEDVSVPLRGGEERLVILLTSVPSKN